MAAPSQSPSSDEILQQDSTAAPQFMSQVAAMDGQEFQQRLHQGIINLIHKWSRPDRRRCNAFVTAQYVCLDVAIPYANEITYDGYVMLCALVLLRRFLHISKMTMTPETQTNMYFTLLSIVQKQQVDIPYNTRTVAVFSGQTSAQIYIWECLALQYLSFDVYVTDGEVEAMLRLVMAL